MRSTISRAGSDLARGSSRCSVPTSMYSMKRRMCPGPAANMDGPVGRSASIVHALLHHAVDLDRRESRHPRRPRCPRSTRPRAESSSPSSSCGRPTSSQAVEAHRDTPLRPASRQLPGRARQQGSVGRQRDVADPLVDPRDARSARVRSMRSRGSPPVMRSFSHARAPRRARTRRSISSKRSRSVARVELVLLPVDLGRHAVRCSGSCSDR